MPGEEKKTDYREEAKRLVDLPDAEITAYLAWQKDIAEDAGLRKSDRDAAAARIKALKRELQRKKSNQNP